MLFFFHHCHALGSGPRSQVGHASARSHTAEYAPNCTGACVHNNAGVAVLLRHAWQRLELATASVRATRLHWQSTVLALVVREEGWTMHAAWLAQKSQGLCTQPNHHVSYYS